MVHSFSINGIKTNMDGTLSGGVDEGIFGRIDLFNKIRDNRGCFAIDKETEEFFQFNTPLSGLDNLQAQAQEQMASVSSIPLVFLLGITPQGLNASSEGEILVFETTIHSLQELEFRDPLEQVLKVIQLSEFGEIDDEITFKFNPLREMTEIQQAEIRKLDADTDAVLIGQGVIAPQDALTRVANDPTSPYHGLETNSDAELTEDE
jgi:phage-related protein (TIGR01555 family)